MNCQSYKVLARIVVMNIQEQIQNNLVEAVKKIGGKIDRVDLTVPTDSKFGDFSTNVAMILAKNLKNNPKELAQGIIDQIAKDQSIDKIEVASAGFINIWLNKKVLINNLSEIINKTENFGIDSSKANEKYLVEFAHPNTHKEFHIGHLRNIITGDAISRILESVGAKITRANYQGDVGMHIAKAIWGIQKFGLTKSTDLMDQIKFLGSAYVEGNRAYEEGEAKSEIEAINKKIYEKSDNEINALYEKTRDWSLKYFQTIYDRLSVKFDRLYFESEVADIGKKITLEALEKKILVKSEGAIIYPGSKCGLHDRVFISQLGTPTYEAKDLGLASLQFKEFDPDEILHVVGPEQSGYFQVLFSALEGIMPKSKNRERHIAYGWVRLKDGKMSSRKGNVVAGIWLLDQVKNKIIKKYKLTSDIAEVLMIGAVKYSFLKVNLASEISFDIDESISIEGNSGPYIQYTVARIFGLFRKANISAESIDTKNMNNSDFEAKELLILRKLIHYPEIIESSAQHIAPNHLCEYLYQLAEIYNSYYGSVRILDDVKNKTNRLILSLAVATVLKNGLSLLGITAPERM